MGLLTWWRRRKEEKAEEAATIDEMRRADEPDEPVPHEAYMSQTRD